MNPAERLNCVNEYYFSDKLAEINKLQQEGHNLINMGIGSPELLPHPKVIKILNNTSLDSDSNMYQSYGGIEELRKAFSKWYQIIYRVNLNPMNEILPLIGSKEGIMHISMAFCNPGDRVLIPDPGYPTYSSASKLLGLDVKYYNLTEENNWLPDFNELENLYNDRTKLIWINYPHMPSGKIANQLTLKKLVMWAKYREVLLVNDNPYSLILNDHPKSILSFLNYYENILELNSLSKSHNMAGWRVGMVAGSQENIKHILKLKSNFDSGMYKSIQLAASYALNLSKDWYDKLNKIYSQRRIKVWKMLDLLECKYSTHSAGLFVWARIPGAFSNAYEFSDYLLYVLGIFATPGSIFGENGNKYIRFSICVSENELSQAFLRITTLKQKVLCE